MNYDKRGVVMHVLSMFCFHASVLSNEPRLTIWIKKNSNQVKTTNLNLGVHDAVDGRNPKQPPEMYKTLYINSDSSTWKMIISPGRDEHKKYLKHFETTT